MIFDLRPAAAMLLAAVMMLTSVQIAVARGHAAPVGEMVLCTGLGTVTVMVDADGNPTSVPHVCPDCALSFLEFPDRSDAIPVDDPTSSTPRVEKGAKLHVDWLNIHATARAPPFFV